MIASDSATFDPHPQSSPKVIPPRQNVLTRSPEFPSPTWSLSAIVPRDHNFCRPLHH